MSLRVLEAFKFRRRNTVIHLLDPRSKFMLLVAFTGASLMLSDPVTLTVLLIGELIVLAVAKAVREWQRSLRGFSLILIMVFVLNYLSLPSNKLFTSLAMTIRFIALTTAFSIFFLTTTPDELALALEASGVPRDYTLMFTMSLRFVPTLARDLQVVADALMSRGLELERGGIRDRVRNYVYLLVPLIVYELRRSLMIAEALEARGFGLSKRVEPYHELRFRLPDYAITILSLALLLALAYAHLSGYYARVLEYLLQLPWP